MRKKTNSMFRSLLTGLLTSTLWTQAIAEPVDVELSLVIDVSGSINPEEYQLQMQGYSQALKSQCVEKQILEGKYGAIAINVVYFATNAITTDLSIWRKIDSIDGLHLFADELGSAERPGVGNTGIPLGVLKSLELFEDNGFEGDALIIDVSGDGRTNETGDSELENVAFTEEARDLAESQGITINGLPILNEVPDLDSYYEDHVITSGGQIFPATDFIDFARAVEQKLCYETRNCVDTQLSLVIDVSGSIQRDVDEFYLQMDGYAAAFRSEKVIKNILEGNFGSTAVNVVFYDEIAVPHTFMDEFFYDTEINWEDWQLLDSEEEILEYADYLDNLVFPFLAEFSGEYTRIDAGINRSVETFFESPYRGKHQIMDVSGDGETYDPNEIDPETAVMLTEQARDNAASQLIKINGLPILSVTYPNLDDYYLAHVITADGFVIPALGIDDFENAVFEKICLETDSQSPDVKGQVVCPESKEDLHRIVLTVTNPSPNPIHSLEITSCPFNELPENATTTGPIPSDLVFNAPLEMNESGTGEIALPGLEITNDTKQVCLVITFFDQNGKTLESTKACFNLPPSNEKEIDHKSTNEPNDPVFNRIRSSKR